MIKGTFPLFEEACECTKDPKAILRITYQSDDRWSDTLITFYLDSEGCCLDYKSRASDCEPVDTNCLPGADESCEFFLRALEVIAFGKTATTGPRDELFEHVAGQDRPLPHDFARYASRLRALAADFEELGVRRKIDEDQEQRVKLQRQRPAVAT